MEFKIYQHRLSALSARFNLMVTLVVLLLLSNLFLAALSFYLGFHQRVEVTPFFGSPRYSNSANTIDHQYLKLMTENFIYARLNVTPETVKLNHERLLAFVDSHQYPVFQGKLNSEANLIMEEKLSSHFDIATLTCNSNTLSCEAVGQLKRAVGLRELTPESLRYVLQFKYAFGQLKIVKFLKEEIHETK